MRKNKSAIKKARQSEERRLRNSHVKSTMKTHIKKIALAMEDKNKEQLEEVFKKAVSYINQASSKKVIHKNNAARKISRLSKKIHSFAETK
ncbi:MAG: 30S ribosomal protein S20 [Proteobacteria bacterium]|nr:30S ribosomal protein S20 [Pseudomonadota bacterium]